MERIYKIFIAYSRGNQLSEKNRLITADFFRSAMSYYYNKPSKSEKYFSKDINDCIHAQHKGDHDFDHLFVSAIQFGNIFNTAVDYHDFYNSHIKSLGIIFTPFAYKNFSKETLDYIAHHIYGHICLADTENIFYQDIERSDLSFDTAVDTVLYPVSTDKYTGDDRENILRALLEIKEVLSSRWFGLWAKRHPEIMDHLDRRIREVYFYTTEVYDFEINKKPSINLDESLEKKKPNHKKKKKKRKKKK